MSETLRAMLLRHADELADKLNELVTEAPTQRAKACRKPPRITRPLPVPPPREMDEVTRARVHSALRRAGLTPQD